MLNVKYMYFKYTNNILTILLMQHIIYKYKMETLFFIHVHYRLHLIDFKAVTKAINENRSMILIIYLVNLSRKLVSKYIFKYLKNI
jgi:hypothetical protein